jgi:hypothetical protein
LVGSLFYSAPVTRASAIASAGPLVAWFIFVWNVAAAGALEADPGALPFLPVAILWARQLASADVMMNSATSCAPIPISTEPHYPLLVAAASFKEAAFPSS